MKQKLLLVGTALALTGGVISIRNNSVNQINAEDPVEVSNYAELQDAVENTKDRKIVLTDDITVSADDVDIIDPWRSTALLIEGISNMEIDGNGHVLQANVTGFDEKGFFNDEPFSKNLIQINDNSSITIKNLIIKGGDRAAILVYDSNLKMFNCTIERSGSVCQSGTGITADFSKVYLKDSKISRCGGEYGGGFINTNGWFVLDGCSLNENRSLSFRGGGGGCENNSDGYSIFNNCTIANNVSTEIGGGINNYGANALIMNSTIVGNLTNYDIGYGGGVGNNGGNLALYNSLLTNNYFVDNEGAHKSDIGLYDYDFNPDWPEELPRVYSFGSKVDEITNEYRGVYPFDIEGITKIDSADSDFAKVVDQAGVLYSSAEEKFYISKNIHRPAIVLNDVGTYSCYLGNESSMLEGGCPTYFHVPEDMDDWDPSSIIAGYKDDSGYKACAINAFSTFSAPEDESFRVNKFQDGTDRIEGVIGSNGAKEINMVSLTVYPGTKGCTADFGTVFGELYPINTIVSINPILKDPLEDVFLYWEDCLDSSKTYPQDYFVNFPLDKDYAIRPLIEGECIITNVTEEASHEIYGGYISAPETLPFNSKIEIEVHPDDGYSLVCLEVSDYLTMAHDFVTNIDNLYCGEGDIKLEAHFWKGKNPVAKENLKFNNSDQELIKPGVNGDICYTGVDHPETGHFEYSLTGLRDDYSEDVPTAKDAGEYTVYWKYVDSYISWLERGGKFNISIDKIKVDKPVEDSTSFTYNGQNQTYAIAANDAYTVTGNIEKEAGTHAVTVVLKDKTNTCWADGSTADLSFDFVIDKVKVAKPNEDSTSFTYNGQNQTYAIAANDAYTVTGNVEKEAGTHKVTVSLKDKANTCWADGSTADLSFDFVINKVKVAKPDEDSTSFTYNGETQTYTVPSSSEYEVTGIAAKDAGTHTVTVALKDKTNKCWADGSTDDLSFNFVINKAKVAKPEADTTAFKFNGEDQTYTIAANSAYEITGNVAKDAGTHTVTVALKDKTNTCWSDGSIDDLTFDFIIAEEDKACFLHWISIGLLVVAAVVLALHIVLKYKALIAYVALGVIDAGAVVTGLLGFILNNCFFCLGTLIGNAVIISLMIVFVFIYSKKRKADKEDKAK